MSVSVDDAGSPLVPSDYRPQYQENAPRAVVVIDGKRYIPNRYTINKNAHGATDTATVTLPIVSNPDFSAELFRGPVGQDNSQTDWNKLTTQQVQTLLAQPSNVDTSPVIVEIYAGFPANGNISDLQLTHETRRFLGNLDVYSPKWGANTVTFAVRSLAQPLVDSKLQQFANNKTTTQFIQEQAASAGLKAVVNIADSGTYLQEVLGFDNVGGNNYAATIYGMHPWDLILRSAQFDDADAWVDDNTLHYESPSLVQRNTVTIHYGTDLKDDAESTHSPLFSKNIVVKVRSYNKRTKTSHTTRITTAPGGGAIVEQSVKNVTSSIVPGTNQTLSTYIDKNGASVATLNSSTGGNFNGVGQSGGRESGKEVYPFYLKNISPATANKLARAIWRAISMQEYTTSGTVAVTNSTLANIKITSIVNVTGLAYYFFNTKYWPRQIDEVFDIAEGWTMHLVMVSHVPPAGAV